MESKKTAKIQVIMHLSITYLDLNHTHAVCIQFQDGSHVNVFLQLLISAADMQVTMVKKFLKYLKFSGTCSFEQSKIFCNQAIFDKIPEITKFFLESLLLVCPICLCESCSSFIT